LEINILLTLPKTTGSW